MSCKTAWLSINIIIVAYIRMILIIVVEGNITFVKYTFLSIVIASLSYAYQQTRVFSYKHD